MFFKDLPIRSKLLILRFIAHIKVLNVFFDLSVVERRMC